MRSSSPLRRTDSNDTAPADDSDQTPQGYDLPLPGDEWDGLTVVASTWINDDNDDGTATAMLMLLRKERPYYEIRDTTYSGGGWNDSPGVTFPNIVPAVEHWQEQGGDY